MAKRRNAGLRALLVDDDPRNRPLVVRELRSEFAAARVERAGDIDSLEQAWEREPVGIVILDANLPWADAASIARRVREKDPECPVILFAEPGSEEAASLAVGANADDYVVKHEDTFIHLSSTVKQILEKGRQADALRKEESRYHDLFDGMPVGLYLSTPAGQILDANPALVQLLGFPDRETLLATNSSDIHARPTDRKRVLRQLDREGVAHEEALRLKRSDGETVIVDEYARAIRDENGRVVAIEGALVDMTERARMEAQLRELTSELQAISKALPDLYFSLAADGTILDYRAGRDADLYMSPQFRGKKMQEILPSGSGQMFADGIARVLRQEQGVTLEYVLPVDGVERSFEARLAPLEGGKIIVVVRDVTDRLQVQMALLESEKRFRTLVERAVDALVLYDMQGTIIDVNQQACVSLGYTREELLGLHVSCIEPEASGPNMADLWEGIARQGPITVQSRHRRKDGSTFPVELRVGSFEAEGRRLVMAQVRDVTERERTERELRESRRTLATLMSNLPGMAYRCRNDAMWTMEFVSQGCLTLTGYEPDDLIHNRRVAYADLIHPDDRQTVRDGVHAGIGREESFQLEYRIRTQAGEIRWVWEQGQCVGKTDDGGLMLEGFIADVTDRRNSEIQLQESQAYLRSIVEAVDDILIVYDADGRYVDVVTRAPGLLRLPRDEMLGHTVHEVLPEQVADRFQQAIHRVIATHMPQVIEYPLTMSGTELWFRARGQLVDSPTGDPARTLWAISEITQSKQAEQALRRREAVLEAVAYAAERFLRMPRWEESIEAVLARLGEAAQTSRAYLFQCHSGDGGERLVSQRFEWVAEGTTSQLEAAGTHKIPRDRGGFARWNQILEAGGVVAGDVDGFEPAEQALIEGQDIRSLLLVPVFIGSSLWGLLGYDACHAKREWTEGEIDALRAAAGALGAAILRERDEAAFHRLEEFHEDIVQNMAEGILVTDAEGRFIFGNAAAAKVLGYAPGELVGMHTRQVVAEDHWPLVEAADERRQRGLSDQYELDAIRKDGTRIQAMVSGSPRMRDGKFDGTLAVFADVTAERQARQALQLAESRFRALVEQSPAAVYMDRMDATSSTIYMSPRIEAMLGYTPEEWAADPEMWPRLIHPDDLDRVLKQNDFTNLKRVQFDQEYRLIGRDGRVVWVRDQAVVLGDDDKGYYWQGVLTDITQRKQSEETLRALLNASPDIAFLMDSSGTILALNEKLARLARRSPEDLIGANIDAFLPPDTAQARRIRFREVVRTGQAARFNDRSQSRWYDNSVYPIFDDEGYVSRMAVFSRDITEQVEAEQALRESEEQFRGLADKSPNMIFINQGGRLVYVNAACCEQMGYTQTELTASSFDYMTLIAPEDRDLIRKRFVAHGRGEEVPPYEYTLCTKDGRRRFGINATKLIKHGGAPAILGIVTDITERRQAEEALRQLTDSLQAIIQASPLGVIMVDPERKVQLWNPAAEKIFGWSSEEVIGGDVPFIPAAEQSAFRSMTERVYAGETITGVELTRVRRDGTLVEIDLSAAPLRGPHGQARGIMAAIADITERKSAVHALGATTEKVRTVFEAVTDGISLVNLDRVFIDGNDAVLRLHGLHDKADLIGRRAVDLIAEVDRARAEADVDADMRTGRSTVHEYRMLRADGSEFIGELSTAWLKDEYGAPAGLVGITRDITERKRAEETLARHARELSVLYQTSIEIGTAVNATAMMQAVMRQATELLGAQFGGLYLVDSDRSGVSVITGHNLPDGIVGTRLALGEGIAGRIALSGEPLIIDDYRNWEGRAPVYAPTTFGHVLGVPLKRGDTVVGVMDFVDNDPDGGFTAEGLRLARLFADQVAGALENARLLEETTRRAAFQEAIVRVAAALRVALTRADLMTIILDQLRELLKVQGAGLIIEEPKGWIIQLGKGTWEGLTGRPLPPAAKVVRDTIESGEPFVLTSIPAPMVASWPEVFASRQSIAVVPLMVERRAIGAMAVARDTGISGDEIHLLTAIAEMAGVALHRAGVMETLEVHVQERTRALAEANDRLKELDRLKSQFVSNVSHELRTPITNVLLYLDLVNQPGKEEKRGMYMSVLKRESERLGNLIEDLLTLSRMDQGAMGLNLELRTLDPVVGEVMSVQRARAEAKGISLNLEPNPEVPPLWIAHQPMIQVFTNLLGNAIAYTQPGGHVSVSSDLVPDDGGWMVAARVHNDGPPIPEEDLPQLFQRFFRGKTGRQSSEPGTGLGLAICREIVERHHGRIEVVSNEEQGTTFTVLLPLPGE